HGNYFLVKGFLYIWSLLNASTHTHLPPFKLLVIAALYDKLIGTVVLGSGLVTHCRLAPGGHRRRTTDRSSSFTTAVRVVAGVHYRTADCRSYAHVALSSRLAEVDVLVVDVSDLSDSS